MTVSPQQLATFGLQILVTAMTLGLVTIAHAEVRQAAPDGFQLAIEYETNATAAAAFTALVEDFSKWYDPSHSYSQEPTNLSIDLERRCMYEALPNGGFVRHMEVVFYHPDQRVLRLTGGMGPLQAMGVQGCMTFAVSATKPQAVAKEDPDAAANTNSTNANSTNANGATLTLTYNVTGAQHDQLDKLAAIVDTVLTGQLKRLREHCDKLAARRKQLQPAS